MLICDILSARRVILYGANREAAAGLAGGHPADTGANGADFRRPAISHQPILNRTIYTVTGGLFEICGLLRCVDGLSLLPHR